MKKVLFVCYGSGHVKMVLPVARALRDAGRAEVAILGLTTAAAAVREAGLPLLQFKDFVLPSDAPALAQGRRLMAGLDAAIVDPEETAAYLGLCYADLLASVGAQEAEARYARLGRQAFLPERTLQRMLRRIDPDLLVATNSPRAERAAVLAARALGVPAICIVDLFAIDEVQWIGAPGYADRVCVLNAAVRDFLIRAGRRPEQVLVTGNPGFDALLEDDAVQAGQALRLHHGWQDRRVLLWAIQQEPAVHPFNGTAGDPTLPARVLERLLAWAQGRNDVVLCVRPRPGAPASLPAGAGGNVVLTGQDWPLAPLLHAIDVAVTLTSTVGLEAHLVGARLTQVQGSVFDDAMPLGRYGIADELVALDDLLPALERQVAFAPRERRIAAASHATARVVAEIDRFL